MIQPRRRISVTWLLALLVVLAGCASPPAPREPVSLPASHALADPGATGLGRLLGPGGVAHPGRSGFLLLDKGEESLLLRAALADRAERTIDIQTFIWYPDNVGTIAAERLLRAADRGVRVRVLVDDVTLTVSRDYLAWLDAHPNVEIRRYNPLANPGASTFQKVMGLLGDWVMKHRRMHNKLFVVDNSVAITGGRNIADEYYDMHRELNFRDRDLLVAGPAVPELSAGFDRFWNSPWSAPVTEPGTRPPGEAERLAYYGALAAYAQDPANLPNRFQGAIEDAHRAVDALPGRLIWAEYQVIADVPGKNADLDAMAGFSETGRRLTELAAASEREILVETPYLVPMPGTLGLIRELRERGVDIRMLTNSYRSTDNPAAYSAYMRARPDLLEAGVRLYEMRPDPDVERELIDRYHRMQDDAVLSLHAKTAVFDRKRVFVGSFNLDPRSTHLNTELGLLVESEELAREVAGIIERDMAPENSWSVEQDGAGGLRWSTRRNGETRVRPFEPDTGLGDAFKMFPYMLIPLEAIL